MDQIIRRVQTGNCTNNSAKSPEKKNIYPNPNTRSPGQDRPSKTRSGARRQSARTWRGEQLLGYVGMTFFFVGTPGGEGAGPRAKPRPPPSNPHSFLVSASPVAGREVGRQQPRHTRQAAGIAFLPPFKCRPFPLLHTFNCQTKTGCRPVHDNSMRRRQCVVRASRDVVTCKSRTSPVVCIYLHTYMLTLTLTLTIDN